MLRSVSAAMLMLVALRGGAAPTDSEDRLKQPTIDTPEANNNGLLPASPLWRSLTLSQGVLIQHYREPDPLGRVSPLDSETGSVPLTQVDLRWRGQLAQALPELVLQTHADFAQGQTAYSGYLQRGSDLAPFSARTGNTMRTQSVRVGLPASVFTGQRWAQQIAPYAEQSWHRWQRNLTLYGETFDWQTTTLGVMALWPLADVGLPRLARFTLEADLAVGRTRSVHLAVPALGFYTDVGATGNHSVALALHYAVTPAWRVGLRYAALRRNFIDSPEFDGLQYPGSRSTQTSWMATMGYHF